MTPPVPPPHQQTVAVIGLGSMGIVAVKNLLDEGFQVTGFERSRYIGGLWHHTDDKETLSVLSSTQANVSVDRGCFTDYPFPEDTPTYCSASTVERYLESYAHHFGLRPHFQLGAAVAAVAYDDDSEKWRLDFADQPPRYFDKVVMATGPHAQPIIPHLRDRDLFQGQITHSRAFKTPQDFKDKRVLILGMGNTGGDVADALVGVASSVAISHNRGAVIIPRIYKGLPSSRLVTQRKTMFQAIGDKYFPGVMERLISAKLRAIMTDSFGEPDPSWRLDPVPPMHLATPVVSDTLMGHLRSGAVSSVAGVDRVSGPSRILLVDGTSIDVDAVICCTGFRNDFSLLDPRYDPSADGTTAWRDAPGSRGRPFPRLYQNVFSIQRPDSLAFLGCVWFATGAFCLADLVSMCIAQVWAGKSALPPQGDMRRWADDNAARMAALASRGPPMPALVQPGEWLAWADKTAGTGVFDRLGWGAKGWKFWWTDKEMWSMLMDGVMTSAMWRLFDEGKRKPWDGARREIQRLNALARAEDQAVKEGS